MKPITYRTLWAENEVRELEGFPTGVPGLLISSRPSVPGFTVVHARSGSLIAEDFDSPEAALGAAQLLGPLADWTQTGIEMQEYPTSAGFRMAVLDAVERYGGWLSGIRSQPPDRLLIDNGVIR